MKDSAGVTATPRRRASRANSALVQLGGLRTIEVGFASTFFASVVVFTILAAKSFDPRLVWDAMEERE